MVIIKGKQKNALLILLKKTKVLNSSIQLCISPFIGPEILLSVIRVGLMYWASTLYLELVLAL